MPARAPLGPKINIPLVLVLLLGAFAWLGPLEAQTERGDWLAGQLLVATEKMGDPRFAGTVIYMIEHDTRGAYGLVVNKPLGDVPLARLLEGLGAETEEADGEVTVYTGGPVDPRRSFVLHSTDKLLEESYTVDEDFAVTTHHSMVEAISEGDGPVQTLFVLGYSGWGPGQLEGELATGAWTSVPADKALVFDEANETKWERALDRFSIEL